MAALLLLILFEGNGILYWFVTFQAKTAVCISLRQIIITVLLLVNLCPRLLGSGPQHSRKAPKSGGSDHTGRDRRACIPAFLQIRPGKADYSDLFPSPLPVWVEGEGGYF